MKKLHLLTGMEMNRTLLLDEEFQENRQRDEARDRLKSKFPKMGPL